jgi:copper chaperone CopZ
MTCSHGVAAVTEEVERIAGADNVDVDLDSGTLRLGARDSDDDAVRAAVEQARYGLASAVAHVAPRATTKLMSSCRSQRLRRPLAALASAGLIAAFGGVVPGSAGTALASKPTPPKIVLAASQLSVAEELGPDIVTVVAWHSRAGLGLRVQVLSGLEVATAQPITARGAKLGRACGTGCTTATIAGNATTVAVKASIGGKSYSATLPVAFDASGAGRAAALLTRMNRGQLSLRSASIWESLFSAPGEGDDTTLQLVAPDRFAYQVTSAGKLLSETIIIGTREWDRTAGQASWSETSYGSQPWSAAAYLAWWSGYDTQARLLDVERTPSGTVADVAAVNNIADLGPVWFRFHIDVTHERLESLRMITAEHFMSQRWSGFERPLQIKPPASRH